MSFQSENSKDRANDLRERGNAFFKIQDFTKAYHCYNMGLLEDDSNSLLHGNMSQVKLTLKLYSDAEVHAVKSIELSRDSAKGYFRAAKAAVGLGEKTRAISYLRAGMERSSLSDNSELKGYLNELLGCSTPKQKSKANVNNMKEDIRNTPLSQCKTKGKTGPIESKDKEEDSSLHTIENLLPPTEQRKSQAQVQRKHAKLEFITLIKDGSELLLRKLVKTAAPKYKLALDILVEYPIESLGLETSQESILKYAISVCWSQHTDYQFISNALDYLNVLEESFSNRLPAIFYCLGFIYIKLNRYQLALVYLEKALNIVKTEDSLERFDWPGSEVVIKETTLKGLEESIVQLLPDCMQYHPPDAICKYMKEKCIAFSNHVLPSNTIYFSDPDFIGYVIVICQMKCKIDFHLACWKDLKEQQNKVGKVSDKDMLGQPCPTDNCVTASKEQSAIVSIKVIGEKGQTKFHCEREPTKIKPPSEDPVGKDTKKTKKKAEKMKPPPQEKEKPKPRPPPVEKKVVEPLKPSRPGRSKSRARSMALEDDEELEPDSDESIIQRLLAKEAVSNNNYIQEIRWDPTKSNYGRDDLVDKVWCRTVMPDPTQDFIYSFFFDFLHEMGPQSVSDLEEKWESEIKQCEQYQDLAARPDFPGIISYLCQSYQFVIVSDYIGTCASAAKVYEMAMSDISECFDFLITDTIAKHPPIKPDGPKCDRPIVEGNAISVKPEVGKTLKDIPNPKNLVGESKAGAQKQTADSKKYSKGTNDSEKEAPIGSHKKVSGAGSLVVASSSDGVNRQASLGALKKTTKSLVSVKTEVSASGNVENYSLFPLPEKHVELPAISFTKQSSLKEFSDSPGQNFTNTAEYTEVNCLELLEGKNETTIIPPPSPIKRKKSAETSDTVLPVELVDSSVVSVQTNPLDLVQISSRLPSFPWLPVEMVQPNLTDVREDIVGLVAVCETEGVSYKNADNLSVKSEPISDSPTLNKDKDDSQSESGSFRITAAVLKQALASATEVSKKPDIVLNPFWSSKLIYNPPEEFNGVQNTLQFLDSGNPSFLGSENTLQFLDSDNPSFLGSENTLQFLDSDNPSFLGSENTLQFLDSDNPSFLGSENTLQFLDSDNPSFLGSENSLQFQDAETNLQFVDSESNVESLNSKFSLQFLDSDTNVQFLDSDTNVQFLDSEKTKQFEDAENNVPFEDAASKLENVNLSGPSVNVGGTLLNMKQEIVATEEGMVLVEPGTDVSTASSGTLPPVHPKLLPLSTSFLAQTEDPVYTEEEWTALEPRAPLSASATPNDKTEIVCDNKACQTSLTVSDLENIMQELDDAKEMKANNPLAKPCIVESVDQMCQTDETCNYIGQLTIKLEDAQELNKELSGRMKGADEVMKVLLEVRKKTEAENSQLSEQNKLLAHVMDESKQRNASLVAENTALAATIQNLRKEKMEVLKQLEEVNTFIKKLFDQSNLVKEQNVMARQEINAWKTSFLGVSTDLARTKASECDEKYGAMLSNLKIAINLESWDQEKCARLKTMFSQLHADHKKASDANKETLCRYESMKANIEQADLQNLPQVMPAQISDDYHVAIRNAQARLDVKEPNLPKAPTPVASQPNPDATKAGASRSQQFAYEMPPNGYALLPHVYMNQGAPGNHPMPYSRPQVHGIQMPSTHSQMQQHQQQLQFQFQQQQHYSFLQSRAQKPSVDISNPNLIEDIFGEKGTGLASGSIQMSPSHRNQNSTQLDPTKTTGVNGTRPNSQNEGNGTKSARSGDRSRGVSPSLDEAAGFNRCFSRDSKSSHKLPKLQNVYTDYPTKENDAKDYARLIQELKKSNPLQSVQDLQKCVTSLQSCNPQLLRSQFNTINDIVCRELEDRNKAKKNAWGPVKPEVPKWKPTHVEEECIICYDKMQSHNTQTLDCQHSFHGHCIKTWVNLNSVCPICKCHIKLTDEYPPLK